MTIIEAKVEAALCSSLSDRKYYVIAVERKKDTDYVLTTTESADAVTWYEKGCEKGEGVHIKVSKWDEAQQKKTKRRTASEIIEGLENAPAKEKKVRAPKGSTELPKFNFKSLEEAAKSTESGLFEFKGKQWAVSVRGSWVLHKHIMEKCDQGGLVLVVRGQGWYNYPKSMWNEFKGIFESTSYDKGSYSQSVLPKKFEKYFKKF